MSDIQDDIKEKVISIEAYVKSLSSKQKVNIVAFIIIGVMLIAFFCIVFFRSKPLDTSMLDKQRKELSDSLAAEKKVTAYYADQYAASRKEIDDIKQQNRKLENAFIENQKNHVDLNKAQTEVSPAISDLSIDSLRSLFLGH